MNDQAITDDDFNTLHQGLNLLPEWGEHVTHEQLKAFESWWHKATEHPQLVDLCRGLHHALRSRQIAALAREHYQTNAKGRETPRYVAWFEGPGFDDFALWDQQVLERCVACLELWAEKATQGRDEDAQTQAMSDVCWMVFNDGRMMAPSIRSLADHCEKAFDGEGAVSLLAGLMCLEVVDNFIKRLLGEALIKDDAVIQHVGHQIEDWETMSEVRNAHIIMGRIPLSVRRDSDGDFHPGDWENQPLPTAEYLRPLFDKWFPMYRSSLLEEGLPEKQEGA